jgi:hypothetical protein
MPQNQPIIALRRRDNRVVSFWPIQKNGWVMDFAMSAYVVSQLAPDPSSSPLAGPPLSIKSQHGLTQAGVERL